MKKFISLIIIILGALGYVAFEPQLNESHAVETVEKEETKEVINTTDDTITVHFLDVGQADAIIVELINNEVMLIDAGEVGDSETVINYLKSLNYSNIDYLVGTHPHADHIGGMENVINEFTIENIYMPKTTTNTKTYEDLLTTISDNNLKIKAATSDVIILEEDNYKIEIIGPVEEYNDLNNSSALIKITYYNNSFLFMGDAEKESEEDITSDIDVDVLKVGHHGSDTSSTKEFIERVTPEYAVISVGEDNKYNLPKQSTIDILEAVDAQVFRTDLDGTVVISSDGNNLTVKDE